MTQATGVAAGGEETRVGALTRLKHSTTAGLEVNMAEPTSEADAEWGQVFSAGESARSFVEAEVISAIEYDRSGDFLATGNKGGRVSIYCRHGNLTSNQSMFSSSANDPQYQLYTEFQSHNAEFDYLKSLEIEEKINQIKWCRPSNGSQCLLSTNDKTIKLWKAHERSVREVTTFNEQGLAHVPRANITPALIRLPQTYVRGHVTTSTAKRIYANAHTYHINSIAINSDGETFMSADDLRVNLWSLGNSDQSFNIVDIKPANMEELTEVITAADFHPTHCNTMMYSTSRGAIKLGDMRQAALCDSYSQVFEEQEDPEARSFFSEIIASISDIKFSPDGRYITARDFLTLKVWDINMNSRPVQTINIHEHLRPRLGDLYESDCIFDKFECAVSGDGNNFITGSYNSEFHIYDRYGRADISITPRTARVSRRHSMPQRGLAQQIAAMPAPGDPDALDFSKKILQTSWHPSLNEVAVSIRNSLFVYAS
ncbi:Protein phosphatase PP2A regulatory subunit B [Phytophthora fragariae]|uniref:Serine/threonine-protein phosphatase 2A 55 kDa regulatory subunit B n=1 Tax=Phytophthora fragariae TaxID=53985 RepID=A0A6A3M9K6_9STRA|nr:Protein phosphatase PP2A regulatory subunit B [Phytophthora fragariae]KAE9134568.1 Protein phosphatase PP2A regulatory subunit B [Phytophthora fragariae]